MKKYVELTYFKPSGKYYCEGSYFSDLDWHFEIYEEVKKMNFTGKLPDLDSGTWDGYILVTPENGTPALIDNTREQ